MERLGRTLRHRRSAAFIAACLIVAGCSAGGEAPEAEAETDAAFAERAASVLFWSREEQLSGYPNMEKLFPAETVRRGPTVSGLPQADAELRLSWEHEGRTWDTETYLAANNGAALLVLKDGEITLERYAFGLGPQSRWTSFSVAKSFSSTLVGAAIRDGAIRSVDDEITDYLPGLKGSAYEGVSVRQLLQMTSGAAWNEDYEDPNSDVAKFSGEPSIEGSDPVVTYMARLKREAEPGTKWVYKTGETNLVGSLVRAATGRSLSDYLSEKIWAPLGMEADAYWMTDLSGGEIAGCCLSATLRDYGRFAQMFMNGARINGEAIVPDGWVNEATTSTPEALSAMNGAMGYGYQWWTSAGGTYQGLGIFGQQIFIDPALQLVIVSWSAWPKASDEAGDRAQQAMTSAIRAHYAKGG